MPWRLWNHEPWLCFLHPLAPRWKKKTTRFYRKWKNPDYPIEPLLEKWIKTGATSPFSLGPLLELGTIQMWRFIIFEHIHQSIGLGCTNHGTIFEILGQSHRDHPKFQKIDMNNSTYQPTWPYGYQPNGFTSLELTAWRLETSHREMARKGYPPAKATRGWWGDGEVFFRETKIGFTAFAKGLKHGMFETHFSLVPPYLGKNIWKIFASWHICFFNIDGNSWTISRFFNCCTFPCSKRLQGERWNNDRVDVTYIYTVYFEIWILNGPHTATKHATHQTLEVANMIFLKNPLKGFSKRSGDSVIGTNVHIWYANIPGPVLFHFAPYLASYGYTDIYCSTGYLMDAQGDLTDRRNLVK